MESNDRMIFILGNPRSGTSLLRIILSSHSKICIPPECGFMQWWWDKYKNWNKADSNSKELVSNFLVDLATSKKIETWRLNYQELRDLILKDRPDDYADLCKTVVKQYAKQKGKQPIILGDKNNYYINHLDFLKMAFKRAYFLGIIRDGRDVACSYLDLGKIPDLKYKPELSTDIEQIALEWKSNNERILDFLDSAGKENGSIVRYEDLVLFPEMTIRQVCANLSMDFETNMLNYYEHDLEPTEFLAWKQKTKQKPDATNIGKYLNQLSSADIACFNKISQSLLLRFNYQL